MRILAHASLFINVYVRYAKTPVPSLLNCNKSKYRFRWLRNEYQCLPTIIQDEEVERRVRVSKRLQFQQPQAVDDDTIVLRNHGAQTRVRCSHNVINVIIYL